MPFIGKCTVHGKAGRILTPDGKDEWLAKMVKRYPKVSPFSLTSQQQRAWGNSYDVLHDTFEKLPSEYGKLELIFEYVLPLHNPAQPTEAEDPGVRPDVILLAKNALCVLEFKDRSDPYPHCHQQARKYCDRLQRWHVESIGMDKKAIAIFTTGNE